MAAAAAAAYVCAWWRCPGARDVIRGCYEARQRNGEVGGCGALKVTEITTCLAAALSWAAERDGTREQRRMLRSRGPGEAGGVGEGRRKEGTQGARDRGHGRGNWMLEEREEGLATEEKDGDTVLERDARVEERVEGRTVEGAEDGYDKGTGMLE